MDGSFSPAGGNSLVVKKNREASVVIFYGKITSWVSGRYSGWFLVACSQIGWLSVFAFELFSGRFRPLNLAIDRNWFGVSVGRCYPGWKEFLGKFCLC